MRTKSLAILFVCTLLLNGCHPFENADEYDFPGGTDVAADMDVLDFPDGHDAPSDGSVAPDLHDTGASDAVDSASVDVSDTTSVDALDGVAPDAADAPPSETSGSCGDGVKDPGEDCDLGSANSDTAPGDSSSVCRTSCRFPHCGDGVVDYAAGERCDDGNTAPGDGCDDACRREPASTCGDGTLDIANDELCDDGSHCADGTDCTADAAKCSDGSCAPRGGDGCDATCTFETVGGACGDGQLAALEVCDDGGTLNGDGCNPTCNLLGKVSLFSAFGGKGALTSDGAYLYAVREGNSQIARIPIAACAAERAAAASGPYPACDPSGPCTGSAQACVLANTSSGSGTETLATDGHTLWYFDRGDFKLHAIDLSDPSYPDTVVAGSGQQSSCTNGNPPDGVGAGASFGDPRATVWFGGSLYMVDGALHLLRRIDPTTGTVSTLAGTCGVATPHTDGVGSGAILGSPRYLTSDHSGNLFFVDTNGNHVRRYSIATGYVGSLVGDGTGTSSYLDAPLGTNAQIERARGLATDGTSLYFGEQIAATVRQVEIASTSVTTLAGESGCLGPVDGTGGTGVAPTSCANSPPNGWARLDTPWAVTFDYPSGALYVMEAGRISKIE